MTLRLRPILIGAVIGLAFIAYRFIAVQPHASDLVKAATLSTSSELVTWKDGNKVAQEILMPSNQAWFPNAIQPGQCSININGGWDCTLSYAPQRFTYDANGVEFTGDPDRIVVRHRFIQEGGKWHCVHCDVDSLAAGNEELSDNTIAEVTEMQIRSCVAFRKLEQPMNLNVGMSMCSSATDMSPGCRGEINWKQKNEQCDRLGVGESLGAKLMTKASGWLQ